MSPDFVTIDCRGRPLVLDRPRIMGVLNVTPDSFSDGGRFADLRAAVDHARRMAEQGADIIDVGGESTRPGADKVSVQQELDRTVPVVERIAAEVDVPVSIDTRKPEVMAAAVAAGAGMINDVNALRTPGALEIAADSDVAVCLMHMQGAPGNMQANPTYSDVVVEVRDFLEERVQACVEAGVARERIIVDPGFGFGKTLEHNLSLLAGLRGIVDLGPPVLAGLSRKSMIGKLLDQTVEERLLGSVVAAVLAVERGAMIVRVHDVAETRDAMRLVQAVQRAPEFN